MSGLLKPVSSLSLSLTGGAPNALSLIFINVSSLPTPFIGGVLLAFPVTAQVFAFTDASGSLSTGTPFTFQVGVADPSVPGRGASLSNPVVGTAF
ncbi:MAG: hypothetical protein ACI9EF_003225 [Pseudohongiellaceae bacterium]|jgi:hypothetical protein